MKFTTQSIYDILGAFTIYLYTEIYINPKYEHFRYDDYIYFDKDEDFNADVVLRYFF